jgi:hypothetical protein
MQSVRATFAVFLVSCFAWLVAAPARAAERDCQMRGAAASCSPALDVEHALRLISGACQLGRWAAVVDLSAVLEPRQRSAEHWLCLARAQAQLGQWVSALDSYGALSDLEPNELATDAERMAQNVARAEERELSEQVPRVTVVLEGAEPSAVQLSLDGEVIPAGRVGVPFAALPGERTVQLRVDGALQRMTRVTLRPGERRVVPLSVSLPPDGEHDGASVAGPAATPARAAASEGPSRRSVSPRQTQSDERQRNLRSFARTSAYAGGITLFGGAALGFGVGAFGGGAGDAGVGLVAVTTLVGGLALLTSGLTYAASVTSEAPVEPVRSGLQLSVGPGGASLSGRF